MESFLETDTNGVILMKKEFEFSKISVVPTTIPLKETNNEKETYEGGRGLMIVWMEDVSEGFDRGRPGECFVRITGEGEGRLQGILVLRIGDGEGRSLSSEQPERLDADSHPIIIWAMSGVGGKEGKDAGMGKVFSK